MRLNKAWMLLLVCGMIGCGGKPQPVVEEPEMLQEGPEAEVSEPDVVEEPKAAKEAAAVREERSQRLGLPVEITNRFGMKLVLIPAGEFVMGSSESAEALAKEFDMEAKWFEKEHPQHRVKITKPLYLGVTEVTQEQYERVMGENPSVFKGDPQRPVETVSWEDVKEFCERLSEKEGKTYQLPTEAQWEYACRSGSTTKWCFGDSESQLDDYAWYDDNSGDTTHPVGQKKPNAWGLYDMHGNVWEWCANWWDDDYSESSSTDPTGPSSGSFRVFRGGSWYSPAGDCRSAYRDYFLLWGESCGLGFRVSRVPADANK
jgi:formylglycine-generating enzyme required for sulfatase activity